MGADCQNQQSQRTGAAKPARDKPKRPTTSFWIRLKEENLHSRRPNERRRERERWLEGGGGYEMLRTLWMGKLRLQRLHKLPKATRHISNMEVTEASLGTSAHVEQKKASILPSPVGHAPVSTGQRSAPPPIPAPRPPPLSLPVVPNKLP